MCKEILINEICSTIEKEYYSVYLTKDFKFKSQLDKNFLIVEDSYKDLQKAILLYEFQKLKKDRPYKLALYKNKILKVYEGFPDIYFDFYTDKEIKVNVPIAIFKNHKRVIHFLRVVATANFKYKQVTHFIALKINNDNLSFKDLEKLKQYIKAERSLIKKINLTTKYLQLYVCIAK